MTRICVIARADLTGLGQQSRNWVRLLNPDKLIVINSKPFNGNDQYFEWYNNRRNAYRIDGFIKPNEINIILNGIDVLITFEIPYNYQLISEARRRGIKTIIQNNWEFTDYLIQPKLPLPDLLVNHSYWHLDDQKTLWPDITEYCPTPLFIEDFNDVYEQNINRSNSNGAAKRFLHIAGRNTYLDRNGTDDLLAAIKLIPQDIQFELVIQTQTTEIRNVDDPRITIDKVPRVNPKDLYRGFDALIMPRRYAGGCLPMTEALASGLPVIMTDIDPNDKILPSYWLVSADKKTTFMARTLIDVYSARHIDLAAIIAQFAVLSDKTMSGYKNMAREIAIKEYSSESVKNKWDSFLLKLGVK